MINSGYAFSNFRDFLNDCFGGVEWVLVEGKKRNQKIFGAGSCNGAGS